MLSLRTQFTVFFSFFLIGLLVATTGAQDLKSVKSRMLERKGAINTLKNQGVIGEGKDGYLHLRQNSGNAQAVVKAENADRRVVYQAIARKEGVPVEKVAGRRAIQLYGIAGSGQWLQKKDGSWFQK